MGLSASVMCRCFREGRTTEPPVPRDHLEVDSDGYLGLKPEYDTSQAYARVDDWKRTGCEHPNMEFAEIIANWAGYRLFQQALGDVGSEHFPVLLRELPEANGGLTGPAASALAIGELERFRSSGVIGTNHFLIDAATGAVVQEQVSPYEGVFLLDGRTGLDGGIDAGGFFFRDRETRVERFRSSRFRQELLEPDRDPDGPEPGRVRFVDLATGREFVGRTAVRDAPIPWPDGRMQDDRGRVRSSYPAELRVESREVRAADFAFIVDPLSIVFRASVATGHPVRWC